MLEDQSHTEAGLNNRGVPLHVDVEISVLHLFIA